ncbi:hypothetical protein [Flavobacterium litorale]|uniref:SnoaL-like domain-containing protein n=1 Tax=Flavobacterium litorale TaxID=2856519 RepID=A0ABX8V351_9FLAO|nr:hypothetical protein [Flavobacterium litorale]QYJ67276.1 hypothetical protein K1I41_06770 [Flavobacterium litorale]
MTKIKIYTTLLLVLISFNSNAQQVQQQPDNMAVKVKEAYNKKAADKIAEFYNYIELITDPALTTEMKNHTATEALKLFENKNIKVYDIFSDDKGLTTVENLIKQSLRQKNKCVLVTDVKMAIPANQIGQVLYSLTVNNKSTINLQQTFIVVTENKKFGTTTRKVRTTYLGDSLILP